MTLGSGQEGTVLLKVIFPHKQTGFCQGYCLEVKGTVVFLVFGHLEFEVEPEMCVTNCRHFPVVTHLIQIKESLSGFQQSLMTS